MNWITVTWPMVAAACLTLGLIELRIGLTQQPPRAARLLFALSAFAVACLCGLELALMQTDVFAEWWPLMRSMDIAVGVMILSPVSYTHLSCPSRSIARSRRDRASSSQSSSMRHSTHSSSRAVSYTHLDVYKRQVILLGAHPLRGHGQ